MKHTLTFALVAALTSTAFAAFQAPLPEFKNEKQLAEWRAERSSEATSQGYVVEETAFYTGRPYLASSGGYAYKYRSYSPELARWTTEDPSGFPDGANANKYSANPINGFDYQGLYSITYSAGVNQSGTSVVYSPNYNPHTVSNYEIYAADVQLSLNGYSIVGGESSNTVFNVSVYSPHASFGSGDTSLVMDISGSLAQGDHTGWIQFVRSNQSIESNGKTTPKDTWYLDNSGSSSPFYQIGTAQTYSDTPKRDVDRSKTITWDARSYYVGVTGQQITVYAGISWGFTIKPE